MEYKEFLEKKNTKIISQGKDIDKNNIHNKLFDYQKDVVLWACKKGKCAIFLDTGLGKTFILLEYARLLNEKTLIISPLSVARQTVNEAKKIDIDLKYVRNEIEIDNNLLFITNYEMIDNFDFNFFNTIILDESSIIKSISGVYKRKIIEKCKNIKYKMACTATPAPNDNVEIGNHAEFLNICTYQEMLAMFFINANKEHTEEFNGELIYKKGSNKGGQEWRLKHHAENKFYEWLSSWAICFTEPQDLNYKYDYKLPKLNIIKHIIDIEFNPDNESLFFSGLKGLEDRVEYKRKNIKEKIEKLKEIINQNEQYIIWCTLQDESKEIKKNINCIEVKGDDNLEYKIKMFEDFQDKKYNILLTKGKIAGFGLNMQQSNNMIFFGLNDSWEMFYQCIRRQWRFGQFKDVNVHIVLTNFELEILDNIMRKDLQAKRLKKGLIEHIKRYEEGELKMKEIEMKEEYKSEIIKGENFTAIYGDSCEELKQIEDESIDLTVYSPPFVDLFVYSDSDRDLGNCNNKDIFYQQYSFIIKELLRITKEGRLSCVHCMDIPALAQKDGYIGVKDFPGDLIRLHESLGWSFYGRAFIQKNPQAQSIRIHSKCLAFKQLHKDSSDLRPALIDQILIFKKDGENKIPINPVKNEEMNNDTWIEWAHGIWTGISETKTLQYYHAREKEDEKHICPLQLETIERCIKLYSNPNETVLTPFMGIGSEIFQALKFGRKGIGIELKKSYFDTAVKNLKSIEEKIKNDNKNLFDNIV
jgi:DNA modification methylase/ERCC4-related helicase